MTVADARPTPDVEFALPDPAVAKDPSGWFASLRTGCPVAHTDAFGGFWMLSRYGDVRDAAFDTAAFSSAGGVVIPPPPGQTFLCLEQDDPEHRSYRKAMQGWFSPGRIAALEPSVRDIVGRLVDEVIDDRHGDLATALAEPVPPITIALLLGLPAEEWTWFRDKNEEYLRLGAVGDLARAGAAVAELAGYLGEKLEERRQVPREDMLTDVANIRIDGEIVPPDFAVSIAFLLLAAGHETTVGAIGGLLYRVAKDTGTRDRLLADPALVDSAVEEALRLDAPLMGLGRTAVGDVTLDGITIPDGDRVLLLWGAANRDPAVFPDPEEFQVGRIENRHLGFGYGIHRCLGAPLARLEMRVVLEEVLRRLPGLALSDDAAVTVSYKVSRSYTSIPATW